MRDLEALVERLEHGDLPLEESLAAFERGVTLTRSCQTALKEAEQKVEILLKKAGEPQVEEFAPTNPKANEGTRGRLKVGAARRPVRRAPGVRLVSLQCAITGPCRASSPNQESTP